MHGPEGGCLGCDCLQAAACSEWFAVTWSCACETRRERDFLKTCRNRSFSIALVARGFAAHQLCSAGEQRLCLAMTSALGCNQGLSLTDWFFLYCSIIRANLEMPPLLRHVLSTVFISVVDYSSTNFKNICLNYQKHIRLYKATKNWSSAINS